MKDLTSYSDIIIFCSVSTLSDQISVLKVNFAQLISPRFTKTKCSQLIALEYCLILPEKLLNLSWTQDHDSIPMLLMFAHPSLAFVTASAKRKGFDKNNLAEAKHATIFSNATLFEHMLHVPASFTSNATLIFALIPFITLLSDLCQCRILNDDV